MRGAAALLDLRVDGARHDVARRELEPLRVVALHEPLAQCVAQDPALAADRLGDEEPDDARRPHHPGGVELDELHVHELRACLVGERSSVAGGLPRVRRDPPALAGAAGGEHDRRRGEHDELPRGAPVAEGTADAVAVLQEPRDRALHEDVDARVHRLVLKRADQLQARAVADVDQPPVRVTAEGPLRHLPVGGAVEDAAPPLQLANAVGRLLGVQLGHVPVVQVLAAEHRVLEVDAPVVVGLDVAERRRDPALGHHRMCLAEQRLADQRRAGAVLGRRRSPPAGRRRPRRSRARRSRAA